MTTLVYDRRSKVIAADTQYTASDDSIVRMNKIERLEDGRYFLGAGHSYPCRLVQQWANTDFDIESEPDWETVLEKEMGFSCLIISKDGETVTYIDEELTPIPILSDVAAIGSGAAFVLAAMDAGADIGRAMEIACARDHNSSAPILMEKLNG